MVKKLTSLLVCVFTAGCVADRSIVAAAVDDVGVGAAVGTTQQGASLTVGYNGGKFAVVPVENIDGRILSLDDGRGGEKSFSVFTALDVNANAGVGGLGASVDQVLAVGPAADIWAAGQAKIAKSSPPPAGQ